MKNTEFRQNETICHVSAKLSFVRALMKVQNTDGSSNFIARIAQIFFLAPSKSWINTISQLLDSCCFRKGKVRPVEVATEQRMGNKKVSLIMYFRTF